MAIVKILKNQKSPAAKITLKEAGVSVPASGNYTIQSEEYGLWTTVDVITELTPLINSGDIVVNDGTADLSAVEGIRYIEKVETLDVSLAGTMITKSPIKINFEGDVNVTDNGTGVSVVTIGETGTVVGKPFQFSFQSIGIANNKWLTVGHPSVSSDDVPWVSPGNGVALAITFSNSNDDIGIDLEIYINGVLTYTFDIRNKKTAWIVENAGLFNVSQGDRVTVFAKNAPGQASPKNVAGSVIFSVTSILDGEGGTQFAD
jgi:hypothetical protein